MDSPDRSARGLTAAPVNPLRYANPAATGDAPDALGTHAAIARLVPVGARVLDVGCGAGAGSAALGRGRQAEVVGVEPDAARAARARELGLRIHTAGWGAPLDEPPASFDVVVFCEVLEHLPDPFQALQEARPWLRPGGCVVASVPNVAHWTVRWRLLVGRFDYEPYGLMDATHLRWFTRASFRRLFTQAGYVPHELHGVPGLWMPEYRRGLWRCLPWPLRWRAIRTAARICPGLFAAQHVIRATPAAG